MKLRCDLIIQNLNTNTTSNQEKLHKQSTIGLYRPKLEDIPDTSNQIILTVETKTLNVKYKLKRIELYTKFINEGKATLKLIDENVYLLISNSPSLTLTNFISFLQIKLAKSNKLEHNDKNPKFVNKLLSNLQCNLGKNSLAAISPLTERDISDVMKIQKNSKIPNQSPIRASDVNKTARMSRVTSASSLALKQQQQVNESKPKLQRSLSSSSNLLVQLTNEQKSVINLIKNKQNIFFTGSGGTGKSFLISIIKKMLPNENCFVTASTGVAASLIGGITIHAFSGFTGNEFSHEVEGDDGLSGLGSDKNKRILERIIKSKDKLNNWKRCQHLIIDEISMIDADYFDTLEFLARSIKNNDEPFGGIQLIISGDFLQLPPVTRYKEEKKKFCFQASTWSECINSTIQLTKIKRQEDTQFIDLLEEIRFGRCSEKTAELLEKSKNKVFKNKEILPTKLCTHKDDVEFINNKEINDLNTDKQVYTSYDSGDFGYAKKMLNILCPAKEEIVLKVNSQVMLIKNLDVAGNLVNGSRGYVVGFNENKLPIVKFMNQTEMVIKHETWTFKINSAGQSITRKQLPLQLAWAISIHKSQGMTLDCVELSLSRVFEYGQAYVALSRAKSLDNLRILDFDPNAIKANETVIKFYEKLKRY
ncbi:unnamed protein product [Brachionus calyciflorus]|uniref:ATP-dependent DNA helicase n=1 Tax=Brachionus calyciflorus TaxID=104777 RepID=A0A813WTK6_9BILA|nr:unnamed protein product [Brachionus calyciflorus]